MDQVQNVFIFNKIKNNDADIELLKQTFGALGCRLKYMGNDTLEELQKVANKMAIETTWYTSFKYVVIIVLDNTKTDPGRWITTDKKSFRINGDLFVPMFRNDSLKGKLLLGIHQTNRTFALEEEDDKTIRENLPYNDPNLKYHNHSVVRFYATSIGCDLRHKWTKNRPSPFIKILCEEFQETIRQPKLLGDILNRIARRVQEETGELPAKEIVDNTIEFGPAQA